MRKKPRLIWEHLNPDLDEICLSVFSQALSHRRQHSVNCRRGQIAGPTIQPILK
jgi:hypothetical protein